MHSLEIVLDTEYSSRPAEVKILCNNEEIFNDKIKSKKTLSYNLELKDSFDLIIFKSGKTKDLVDAGHTQIITIEKVKLNGIDLKIDSFGMFFVKDNPYLKNKELQTATLQLNGKWSLSIPFIYSLPGHLTCEGKILQEKFVDSDICCFGASNTSSRQGFECWPNYLANISKLKVQNYGIPGSGWQEITRLVHEYSKLVKGRDLVILSPLCFRFQIQDTDEWFNCNDWELLKKDIVLHGTEHYVALLSANICGFFDKISESNNIYFCPDSQLEHDLFQKTPLKKYLIPYIEFPETQLAKDRHWNDEWNYNFAKKTASHIGVLNR